MKKIGAIGIDFGTTKTTLVYAEPGKGRGVIIDSFPTAIRFTNEKEFAWNGHVIGRDASMAPQGWRNFKKFMGEQRVPVKDCCNVAFEQKDAPSPVLLASFVFRHLMEKIKAYLRLEEDEIGPVTITIPSERNFLHRQAVVFAANIAGFKNVSILEEPVGAYLFHYFTNPKLSRSEGKLRVFVIDFGGGTCDLVIAESDNGQAPIVVNSRTIEQAGNDIDDAIVGLWMENDEFGKKLASESDGEYELGLSQELKETAKLAKHQCNPRPDATPDGIISLLRDPLASQRNSDNKDPIKLPNKALLLPPNLTPQDFDRLMVEFLQEIDKQIAFLLPNDEELQSINKVVFAGGSCYIRQVLSYIVKKFDHLNPAEDFLFNDPENAIAYGALEYQRERNEERNPIRTRLPMSTYLQVDYDSNDIPAWVKSLNFVKFITYNGKSYIELARKGEPLTTENPNVGATILAPMTGSKVITIPLKKSMDLVTWKIFQVRSTESNGHDYEVITDKTRAIDEIAFLPSALENAINIIAPLRLTYAFDIYGDFYRNARLLTRIRSNVQNMHEKNPRLDWRNMEKVNQTRKAFFGDSVRRRK